MSAASVGYSAATYVTRRGTGFSGVIGLARRSSGPRWLLSDGGTAAVATCSGKAPTAYQLPKATTSAITAHDATIRLDDITTSLDISIIRRNR